jgi:hypothetical protein
VLRDAQRLKRFTVEIGNLALKAKSGEQESDIF